jgi:flagellar basal-body rod modification protein FlgD
MAITPVSDRFAALNDPTQNTARPTPSAQTTTAASTSTSAATTAADTSQRFLKLLVTQMQNQDPLNPTDNAQITSQMAQINTVEGISQLNTTMNGLNSQFVQLQALQGASLVGHTVTVKGNKLTPEGGTASGGFELATAADSVRVQVINGAGAVIDTVNLAAQAAGPHSFNWSSDTAPDGAKFSFKVVATSRGDAVAATPYMRDKVVSVSSGAGGLTLTTANAGDVAYADIKSFD